MTKMAFFVLALIVMTSTAVAVVNQNFDQNFAIIMNNQVNCILSSSFNESLGVDQTFRDGEIDIVVKLILNYPNELPLHYLSTKVISKLNEIHLFYLKASYELLRHDAYLETYSAYFQKFFKKIGELRHRLSTFIQEKEVTHGKWKAVFDHSCVLATIGFGTALDDKALEYGFDLASLSLGNKLDKLFERAILLNNDITFKLVHALKLIGGDEALEDDQMVEFLSRDLIPEFSNMKKDLVSQQHLVKLEINSSSHILYLDLMMN